MTDTNITAWRVAAALALACGLDWGRWAAGLTADVRMVPFHYDDGFPVCEGWCLGPDDGACPLYVSEAEARAHAVPDPSNVDAYLADCARRGVEPGPLPSLSWTSDDKHTTWCVTSADVFLSIGAATVEVRLGGPLAGRVRITSDMWTATAADLKQLSTLVTAAAAALETST